MHAVLWIEALFHCLVVDKPFFRCIFLVCEYTELLGCGAFRYRVFLGNKQYFVSSDVGGGKMQWYAFYNEPAGGVDRPGGMSFPFNCQFSVGCCAPTPKFILEVD